MNVLVKDSQLVKGNTPLSRNYALLPKVVKMSEI